MKALTVKSQRSSMIAFWALIITSIIIAISKFLVLARGYDVMHWNPDIKYYYWPIQVRIIALIELLAAISMAAGVIILWRGIKYGKFILIATMLFYLCMSLVELWSFITELGTVSNMVAIMPIWWFAWIVVISLLRNPEKRV